jgi:hypothetical protein
MLFGVRRLCWNVSRVVTFRGLSMGPVHSGFIGKVYPLSSTNRRAVGTVSRTLRISNGKVEAIDHFLECIAFDSILFSQSSCMLYFLLKFTDSLICFYQLVFIVTNVVAVILEFIIEVCNYIFVAGIFLAKRIYNSLKPRDLSLRVR